MTANNLPKHNDKYPQQAAEYAANKWPCTTGDTTVIIETDSAQYLQSIQDLEYSVSWLNEINDSLWKELASFRDTTHSDTICRKYAPVIKQQQKEIENLRFQLDHILPIFVTNTSYVPVIDSANNTALRLAYLGEQKRRQELETQVTEWRAKALIRFWMLIAFALAVIVYVIYKLKKV